MVIAREAILGPWFMVIHEVKQAQSVSYCGEYHTQRGRLIVQKLRNEKSLGSSYLLCDGKKYLCE